MPLARKWRPQSFDQVIGQPQVTVTLQRAIEQDRVASAYLFAGPRGVGKTSMARILARALNCAEGPTPTPCGHCASCQSIARGSNLDVLEIDGASHTQVDHAREIRENARLAPASGRYKLYIIDEAHMLSDSAFNALLKTLEEPPRHVKFVFATTHPHKIPTTIISRCQRFDFRPISSAEIATTLSNIAVAEGITLDESAAFLIARTSEGSLRDAEMTLDQVVAASEEALTAEVVAQVLGFIDRGVTQEALTAIVERNTKQLLELIDQISARGQDLLQFVDYVIRELRDLLVIQVEGVSETLIERPVEEIGALRERADHISRQELLYLFRLLTNARNAIYRSPTPRLELEVALVKAADRPPLVNLAQVLTRLEALEKSISLGSMADVDRSPTAAPAVAPTPGGIKPVNFVPDKALQSPEVGQLNLFTPPEASRSNTVVDGAPAPEALIPLVVGTVEPVAPQTETSMHEPVEVTSEVSSTTAIAPEPVLSEPIPPDAELTLEAVQARWGAVIQRVKQFKPYVGHYLEEGTLLEATRGMVTIVFAQAHRFHKDALERCELKTQLDALLSEVIGQAVRLQFTLQEPKEGVPELVRAADVDDPILDSAVKIFGGQLVRQQPNGNSSGV